MVGTRNVVDEYTASYIGEAYKMCTQAIRQLGFSAIPERIHTLASGIVPPERDTVHLALEDLLVLSLLCLWWALIIVFCLEALR